MAEAEVVEEKDQGRRQWRKASRCRRLIRFDGSNWWATKSEYSPDSFEQTLTITPLSTVVCQPLRP